MGNKSARTRYSNDKRLNVLSVKSQAAPTASKNRPLPRLRTKYTRVVSSARPTCWMLRIVHNENAHEFGLGGVSRVVAHLRGIATRQPRRCRDPSADRPRLRKTAGRSGSFETLRLARLDCFCGVGRLSRRCYTTATQTAAPPPRGSSSKHGVSSSSVPQFSSNAPPL